MKILSETKKPIKMWLDDIEIEAEKQLRNLADLPFIEQHVAVMPDAHAGRGSTVGTVIATSGAIIPSAVGVDIGCGMCAVKLPFKIDQIGDIKKLRSSIERSIPVGFNAHNEIKKVASDFLASKDKTIAFEVKQKHAKQLGTLGGGNHFIEICHDLDNNAWVMLHSGSRNIGKELADKHINSAKDLMKKYFIDLPDPDLAYLAQGTKEFKDYIHDLHWAQEYAMANREIMMEEVLKDISFHVYNDKRELNTFKVNCHHNYTGMENHFGKNMWVTRKGAVSARLGEYGIIPGSMGAKSFIVEGLGNAESFCSCSHGAGRKMSRTKARALYTENDLIEQTSGVECRKDGGVVDEIPSAYKDIDKVMANQSDLVKPIYQLKQIICVKG